MILAKRSVSNSIFNGANLILLRDWLQPVDALTTSCFRSFDEALAKLRSDSEATRIMATRLDNPILGDLNTATQAALRSLPERHRTSTDFYSLAVTPDLAGAHKALWFNIPSWAYLHIETASGDLFRLVAAGHTKGWQRVALEEGDHWVHVSFFSPDFEFKLRSAEERPRFARLSRLVEESQRPELTTYLSVAVNPNPDEAL